MINSFYKSNLIAIFCILLSFSSFKCGDCDCDDVSCLDKQTANQLADLVVSAANLSEETAFIGQIVNATITVTNLFVYDANVAFDGICYDGTQASESDYKVEAWYREDANDEWVVVGESDPYFTKSLGPNEDYVSDEPNVSHNVPGEYYFRPVCDMFDVVNESNEDNNGLTTTDVLISGKRALKKNPPRSAMMKVVADKNTDWVKVELDRKNGNHVTFY